jgi:hypothetical protein
MIKTGPKAKRRTLSFGPVFIILSLSYEAIFYAVYAAALVIWMLVESAPRG